MSLPPSILTRKSRGGSWWSVARAVHVVCCLPFDPSSCHRGLGLRLMRRAS